MKYFDPKTGRMIQIGRPNAATPLLDEAARMTKRLTVNDLNDHGCMKLAEAVVTGMIQEYMDARKAHRKFPFDPEIDKQYRKARGNILSEHFARLSTLDGKEVLRKLDNMRG